LSTVTSTLRREFTVPGAKPFARDASIHCSTSSGVSSSSRLSSKRFDRRSSATT